MTSFGRMDEILYILGFLGVVKVSWCHSHTVGDANVDSLIKLKVSDTTKKEFISYFEMGMGPSHAKSYHQEVLESQPDFNPGVTLADSSVNPKDHVVHSLYNYIKQCKHMFLSNTNAPNNCQNSKTNSSHRMARKYNSYLN